MVTNEFFQFGESVIGYNHRLRNIVCQDDKDCFLDDNPNLMIIAIADGHGSEPLSQFGAEKAVKVACDNIAKFVKEFEKTNTFVSLKCLTKDIYAGVNSNVKNIDFESSKMLLLNKFGYKNIIEVEDATELSVKELSVINDFFHKIELLEKYIVYDWNKEIDQCFNNLRTNKPDYIKELNLDKKDLNNFSHLFGTTLLASVITNDYWFAIQVGDGTCVALFDDNCDNSNYLPINQPIPSDERCYKNITTSLCDLDAFLDFRHCVGIRLPKAIFLGSDGIENSFPDSTNPQDLNNFYISLIHLFAKEETKEQRNKILIEKLKYLTEEYSGDDVSIVGLINKEWLNQKKVTKRTSEYLKLKSFDEKKEYINFVNNKSKIKDNIEKQINELNEEKNNETRFYPDITYELIKEYPSIIKIKIDSPIIEFRIDDELDYIFACDINSINRKTGDSILQTMIELNQKELAIALIKAGAKIDNLSDSERNYLNE